MRILRGKSSLEVSSQGFAWFVVGLVLATFLGGAVRTILSSDRVQQRIVSELRSRFPKHEFKIGRAEVLLSSGMWPGLGLRVHGLSFRQDVCGKLSFVLDVPTATLPVDMFSLRKGKMRLGRVELQDGVMHLDYRPCSPEAPSSPAAAIASVDPAKKFEPRTLNWRKASEHLNGIELRNFQITYERNPTWKISIDSMDFDLGSTELSAHGDLAVHKSLPFGEITHVLDLEAHGDERQIQWSLGAEFKEGGVNLSGSLDLTSNAAVISAKAKLLPLKDLMSELYQMGFVERDLQLKGTWLSCTLKWQGQLGTPEATPVAANDCKLEGGYGRIHLDNADYWMGSEQMFRVPAKFRIERLQVQPLLEAVNRKVLPAVLARPGTWSGELEMLGANSWKLTGALEQLEVIFSNRSVRGKQLLERVRTSVTKSGSVLKGRLDEMRIQGGEFEGALDFELQEDWRNGVFSADVRKLRFNPSIQTLLVGGTLGPILVKGEGSLQSGELGGWKGVFELSDASGVGWSGEQFQLQSRYQPGVFQLEGRAKSMAVTSSWPQFPQLRVIVPEPKSPTQWRDIVGKFEIQRNGGTIQSISAIETERAQPWRFKGSWVRDGEFTGVLAVGAGRPASFNLRGEKGVLVVQEEATPSR